MGASLLARGNRRQFYTAEPPLLTLGALPPLLFNRLLHVRYDDFESQSVGNLVTGTLYSITSVVSLYTHTVTIAASTNAYGTGNEAIITISNTTGIATESTSLNLIDTAKYKNRHVWMKAKIRGTSGSGSADASINAYISINGGTTYYAMVPTAFNVDNGADKTDREFNVPIFMVCEAPGVYSVYVGGTYKVASSVSVATPEIRIKCELTGSGSAAKSALLYIDEIYYSKLPV